MHICRYTANFRGTKNCWISIMSESQVKYRQGWSAGFLKNKKTEFKFLKKKNWAHQFENSFLVRIRWSIFIHPVAYQLYTAHTWYYRSARTHASATIIYTQAISAAKIFMRRQEGRDFRCAYRVLFGPRGRRHTHTYTYKFSCKFRALNHHCCCVYGNFRLSDWMETTEVSRGAKKRQNISTGDAVYWFHSLSLSFEKGGELACVFFFAFFHLFFFLKRNLLRLLLSFVCWRE